MISTTDAHPTDEIASLVNAAQPHATSCSN
jgi:hypothetical protein